MEIEYTKDLSNNKKIKTYPGAELDIAIFKKPLKQQNRTNSFSSPKQYHLNNVEKAFIYLHNYNGAEHRAVADLISRDLRTVGCFLKESDSKNPFASKDYKKGRWPKKGTKLNERHKKFLMRWVSEGSIGSAKQAHSRLNTIKTLSPISYNPVRIFLHNVVNFVKPSLKPSLSD